MHTIWKGHIQFGLVSIPIKLHAATENKNISFRNIHEECGTPIQYQKYCPNCREEVSNNDIEKAYEYGEGKFIKINDRELNQVNRESKQNSIEVLDFVRLSDIDPMYYDKTYFIGPNEAGVKAYALLRDSIKKTKKIAVAKVTIRSKEHLAVIRVIKKALIMETIFYPDEVREINDIPNLPGNIDLTDKEVETAETLIKQLTTEFNPNHYTDAVRLSLHELIQDKLEKEQDVITSGDKEKEDINDLMEALQASIDKEKSTHHQEEERKKKAKKAT
ncbi:non-homologous end joining protein Ku [Salibacterium aidingense]|uniref:non-homologous end joining protein Ku n=1 Tax=Salibacterium aidingense TaxID=384933 RepID=UPI00041598D1|nr:Ku protein [Salibacterium aidingense]